MFVFFKEKSYSLFCCHYRQGETFSSKANEYETKLVCILNIPNAEHDITHTPSSVKPETDRKTLT